MFVGILCTHISILNEELIVVRCGHDCAAREHPARVLRQDDALLELADLDGERCLRLEGLRNVVNQVVALEFRQNLQFVWAISKG